MMPAWCLRAAGIRVRTQRAVIAPSFIFGLADLPMGNHFDLGRPNGKRVVGEIPGMVTISRI